MRIQFWGVRGSIPTPLTPPQVRKKIEDVVQRISPKDVADDDSRRAFLDNLPQWIYGSVGGNTPCVDVTLDDGSCLIFDCGSGLRSMGKSATPPKNGTFHILLSHFHWDHIQGLPFFDFAYNPRNTIIFYSAFPDYEKFLYDQMKAPYFPVTMVDSFTKKISFQRIEERKSFTIGSATIETRKMQHPGGSYAYTVTDNGRKFIYATDVELSDDDFTRDDARVSFFHNADAIVLDAQYSFGEAIQKENWGHSAFCYAIDFADFWKIKKIYLFHHEPSYDDAKIFSIYKAAEQYSESVSGAAVQVFCATEGSSIDL